MTLRGRLQIILVPALLGLLSLAVFTSVGHFREARTLRQLEQQNAFVGTVGALVHELQVERGLSAGFLASKGARFGDELRTQREKSDQALARMDAAARDPRADRALEHLRATVDEGTRAAAAQIALRTRIDALGLSGPESFTSYSATIDRLLTIVGRASVQAEQPLVARRAAAAYAFSYAKEFAGRERATLNNVFVAKGFDPLLYQRALSIFAAQDVYLAQFHLHASEEARRAHVGLLQGAEVEDAAALRAHALAARPGEPLDVDPARWFRVITGKIERMRQVELALAMESSRLVIGESTQATRTAWLSALFSVLTAAVAIGLGAWQSRTILASIGGEPDYAASVARRVAAGDLTCTVVTRDGDESSLLAAMKHMRDQLFEVVGRIRATTDTVGTAAQQIAAGNADLAQRTEEQAASLEKTAASMEQLTATVKQNAASAEQARSLSVSASALTEEGGRVVHDVVDTMRAIRDASRQIAEITEVIDGIAFQTKILALNATVEAARVGEQGRGFAVVALEVRDLAGRTAAAAKQIGGLVRDAGARIAEGTERADQAGRTLGDVVSSVQAVVDMVTEISAASAEQSLGIEQVNEAITQMDQVTEQNAALVEESAAAADSMEGQAKELLRAVSVFELEAAVGAPPPHADALRGRRSDPSLPGARTAWSG